MSKDAVEFIKDLGGLGLDEAVGALGKIQPKNKLEELLLGAAVQTLDEQGRQGLQLLGDVFLRAVEQSDAVPLMKQLPAAEASDLLAELQEASLGEKKRAVLILDQLGNTLAKLGAGILKAAIPG